MELSVKRGSPFDLIIFAACCSDMAAKKTLPTAPASSGMIEPTVSFHQCFGDRSGGGLQIDLGIGRAADFKKGKTQFILFCQRIAHNGP